MDAEVEKVLGPRLFTIDEPAWGDLEGELMVMMTTSLAALVKEDDRVTVEGTVRPFLPANFKGEWGWLGITHETEVKIARKPVLVADRVIGGNDKRSLIIDANAAPHPVGTTGNHRGDIAGVGVIANGSASLVGRQVHLSDVSVDKAGVNGGFLVRSGVDRVFVLPGLPVVGPIAGGNTVDVDGVINADAASHGGATRRTRGQPGDLRLCLQRETVTATERRNDVIVVPEESTDATSDRAAVATGVAPRIGAGRLPSLR